jgi:hypothetical protein
MTQERPNEEPEEVLISDNLYLVKEYRTLLSILQDVRAGEAPVEDLEIALDTYVRFKLPKKFAAFITPKDVLEAKYRRQFASQITEIETKYQSEEKRQRELTKVFNEIKFNAMLDNIEELRDVLEQSGLMNNFAAMTGAGPGLPRVIVGEEHG